ncbi:MAG: (Fe-S)-binding protein [Nitrospinae bacterium]|nr:(Fe-S)-binding protein [Nitrospinota bacterium]
METDLKTLRPLIDKCVMCGGCHPDCPTYKLTRYEHDSARGKVVLAGALLDGSLSPTKELSATFNHCLSCMACTSACPAGADPARVIVSARGELFKKYGGYFEKFLFRKMLTSRPAMPFLAAFFNLTAFMARLFPRLPFLSKFSSEGKQKVFPDFSVKNLKGRFPEKTPAKGNTELKVAYFVGCMADWAFQSSGAGVINALSSVGAEVTLVKDEVCCGAPAYFAGDLDAAKISAEKNAGAFAGRGFDYIVTSCATCGSMLRDVYPALLGKTAGEEFAAKVTDFQKLYADRMPSKPVPADGKEKKVRVTYHDPCHLSRGMKITAEPRRILSSLPGVEFVEMADASACCGGAGAFNAKNYAESVAMGEKKGRNIQASGAQIVVTECPSCQMQLMDLTARFSPGVEVLQMSELIARVRR